VTTLPSQRVRTPWTATERRRVVLLGVVLALLGAVLLVVALVGLLWLQSVEREEARAGNLAAQLGERTQAILIDTRDLLLGLEHHPAERCSPAHLQTLLEAAATRPHLRALGHWRAGERLCGVGFVGAAGLRPPKADRIYESGVLAWWPSPATEVGGVPMFLMRFGQHDVAIDPRRLIDTGAAANRRAALWVEGLRMVSMPSTAQLPEPQSLREGLVIDTAAGQLISRYSHSGLLPIDVVAVEPLSQFWSRQRTLLAVGGVAAVALLLAWLLLLGRFLRWRLSPQTALRRALRDGQIVAHYQPVIDIASGVCVGAEALVRWQQRDGSQIGPDEFLPLAEHCGLSSAITATMLDAVLADLPTLRAIAPTVTINLNLTPHDLQDAEFERALAEGLRDSGLPASAIKLEITERGLLNSELARGRIARFRQNGHQVAVDDFGTGYSSLGYLQSFELDILKIDKIFVDAIGTGAATSQVITHVIEMARALGLSLVAEGVQAEAQADWLRSHAVTLAQGYLYSPALPAQGFAEYLMAHAASASASTRRVIAVA